MKLKTSYNRFINNIPIRKSKERLIYFSIPFLIFYIIMIVRLLELTIVYEDNISTNVINHSKTHRTIVLDRNNNIIATNLFTVSVFANSNKVKDPDNTAKKIANTLSNTSKSHLYELLASKKNFVWIKRHITPKEFLALKSLGLAGIYFQNDEKRVYPQGNLFSHILGYVDMDNNGLSGIEWYINSLKERKKAIKLSVDLRVQNIVRNELLSAIYDNYNALSGTGIVLDTKSGEIISMISIPDFDPNNQSRAKDEQKFNRATLATYEMGSIFKLFTVASALDSGLVKLENEFDVSEPLTIGQFTLKDFHKPKKNKLNISEIFAQSSNIGIAKIAINTGKNIQIEYLKKFGLLSELNIEIPEKSIPISPKKWSDITFITLSYGYGIAVTPLHVAQATAALVNGGMMRKATLIYKNPNNNNSTKIISDITSKNIRKLLRTAVKKGTGKKADAFGYLVGGKTGSAEKVVNGKYQKDANISSFIGVFPISHPKYIVFVLIDEPHSKRATGGIIAAPIVKNIINKIAPMLNIAPENQLIN